MIDVVAFASTLALCQHTSRNDARRELLHANAVNLSQVAAVSGFETLVFSTIESCLSRESGQIPRVAAADRP